MEIAIILHSGYPLPLHAGSIDISLPSSQLLRTEAITLAGFVKRQTTALNLSHPLPSSESPSAAFLEADAI